MPVTPENGFPMQYQVAIRDEHGKLHTLYIGIRKVDAGAAMLEAVMHGDQNVVVTARSVIFRSDHKTEVRERVIAEVSPIKNRRRRAS